MHTLPFGSSDSFDREQQDKSTYKRTHLYRVLRFVHGSGASVLSHLQSQRVGKERSSNCKPDFVIDTRYHNRDDGLSRAATRSTPAADLADDRQAQFT